MPPVGRQSAIANGTANKKFLTETGLLMEVPTKSPLPPLPLSPDIQRQVDEK